MRHGERLKITEERLEQVEGFFDRRGGMTILIGRFIGLVRALAPFIAGASRMPLRALPALRRPRRRRCGRRTFCVLGYVFWRSFDKLDDSTSSRGLFAFGDARRGRSSRSSFARPPARSPERARRSATGSTSARRPAGSGRRDAAPGLALAAAVRGRGRRRALRLDRLTPGDLGLELTTLLALAARRRRSRSSCSATRARQPGMPRLDRMAFDVADRLYMRAARLDIVKVRHAPRLARR